MGKFDMTWRDHLRRSQGLRWKGKFPTPADYPWLFKAMNLIGFCVLVWVVSSVYIAASIEIAEREAQEARAEKSRAVKTLIDCMNGEARFVSPDGREGAFCVKAVPVKN